MKYYIYTLTDPRDNLVKYIGYTKNLKKRLENHLWTNSKEKTKKSSWIKSLTLLGLKPIMEKIDYADSLKKILELEIYWIAQFKAWGFELKNHTIGGEGNNGGIVSQETREKLRKVLKDKYSKESHKLKGRKWSVERKQEQSTILKKSEKHKESMKLLHEFKQTPVIKLSLDNEYLGEYPSIQSAARDVKINASGISVAINKLNKSAGGFRWVYKKDYPLKKDSWTRLEIEGLLHLYKSKFNLKIDSEEEFKWIENNL